MTFSQHDPGTTEPEHAYPIYEDAIDLKEYVYTLVRWRREILLITVLTMLVTAGSVLALRQIQAPQYEASALVASLRVRSQVSFDDRFTTNAEGEGVLSNEIESRRLTLVGLASSGEIAEAVIAELGDLLEPEERTPSQLIKLVEAEMVSGDARTNSDLIRITATTDSPAKATAIANAWTRYYVQEVNHLYGGSPIELKNSISAELIGAETDYKSVQSDLEGFIEQSQRTKLTRQIGETEALISSLQRGKQTATTDLLSNYYASWGLTQSLLDNAQALKQQFELGDENAVASAMLAVQLLKTQAFAGANLPQVLADPDDLASPNSGALALQLQVPELQTMTREQAVADMEGLIATLEARLADLESAIADLNERMLSNDIGLEFSNSNLPLGAEIDKLEQALQTFKSKLEADNAHRQQLTLARDSAWDTFKTLKTKATELELVDAAVNSEVRLASPAVQPLEPVPGQSIVTTTLLAAVVGLMLAIGIAFFATMMNIAPFLGEGGERKGKE